MAISGVKLLAAHSSADTRGTFKKVFQESSDNTFDLRETFFTQSFAGVVRGMHLQISPKSGFKIVSLINGDVFDVLIDLRRESPTYLEIQTSRINSANPISILVPEGVAHGFQAISDSTMLYQTEYIYSRNHDTGINIYSLDIEWPLAIQEISERDQNLPTLEFWLGRDSL
jgi:dTDP-4-dehydrorhamnose 3,5-epimerase